MEKTISKCAGCGYPLTSTPTGTRVDCPMCKTTNESISQSITAVTVPTPVVVGLIAFAAGVVVGPALLSGIKAGTLNLERRAVNRLSR